MTDVIIQLGFIDDQGRIVSMMSGEIFCTCEGKK